MYDFCNGDKSKGKEAQSNDMSPPESPTKRKVTFADNLGHSLVSIKTITPNSSVEELATSRRLEKINLLHCDFVQPASLENFKKLVERQKVCLENIAFSGFAITGTVIVKNICFAKDVTIRYTMNKWRTFHDVWADYVNQLEGGLEDRFQFRIYLLHSIEAGSELEFAVRFRAGQLEYWDNNKKRNYRVICREPVVINNPGNG